MIFNFYLFNKHCECIYYRQWSRPNPAKMSAEEEKKLVYGLIFSLKNFCQRLSPDAQNDGFIGYKTSAYRLHYYETLTGLKFVLLTDPNVGSMKEVLRQIYIQYYVEYVAKNPLHSGPTPNLTNSSLPRTSPQSLEITNELFIKSLDSYIQGLTVFN